eukprot:GHVT01090035.1.p1 GENE.GHVT01090035.1~~GHVT01090035.1.p1  ORF type:complete len:197 (+),score=29.76 GHVT01090035.1:1223-1813(+)
MFRSQFLEHFVCENKRVFNRLILFFSLEPFRLYARHVKDVASGEGRAQLHATELPRGSWGLRISLARDARLFAAKGQSSLEPVDRACVLQALQESAAKAKVSKIKGPRLLQSDKSPTCHGALAAKYDQAAASFTQKPRHGDKVKARTHFPCPGWEAKNGREFFGYPVAARVRCSSAHRATLGRSPTRRGLRCLHFA